MSARRTIHGNLKEGKRVRKFWSWAEDEKGERELFLDGSLVSDSWFGEGVTPEAFKQELYAENGAVTVWINSPGGDVLAGALIYSLLKEYKGRVTVKIAALAASAASVIAMAGDKTYISLLGFLVIHNPYTLAIGDEHEMNRVKTSLAEMKEAAINAYAAKTGLSRAKIAKMMDDETWMSARKAVDLGFADGILYADEERDETRETSEPKTPDKISGDRTDAFKNLGASFEFSRKKAMETFLKQISNTADDTLVPPESVEGKNTVDMYAKRLELLKF
jgi:ATP-dependent Clp protease protease subunit